MGFNSAFKGLIRNKWFQLYSSVALSQRSVGLEFMWTHESDYTWPNLTKCHL